MKQWLWTLLLAPTLAFAGVGTIEHDEGRTWNERKSRTENINIGYDVLMDDFYQTGEDGQIGIIFEDETSVTVIENSELLIDDFVYDPNTKTGKLSLKASLGRFTFKGNCRFIITKDAIRYTPKLIFKDLKSSNSNISIKNDGRRTNKNLTPCWFK